MSDVLERNLQLLLTRAWRPPRPEPAFRAGLRAAFVERAARFGRPRARHTPLWIAAAAALLVVGLAWRLLSEGSASAPPDAAQIVARGEVAWRAGAGPWRAAGVADGVAELGPRAAPLEVRTPGDAAARLEWAGGALRLGRDGALELRAEAGGERAWLAAGGLEARADAGVLTLASAEGQLALERGTARLALEPEALSVALEDGRGRLSDLPGAREVEGPGRWRLRGGRVLDPEGAALARGEGRTSLAAPAPQEAPEGAQPPASLRGRVRAPDGFEADGSPRWRAVPRFRVFVLRAVALPMAVLPEIVEVDDAEGRFALPELVEGDYVVFVDAPDHAVWRSEPMPLGASPTDADLVPTLDVRLEPGVTLSGVVRDASGAPLAGAVVLSERDAPIGVLALSRAELAPFTFLRLAVTDADGGWVLEHVARGEQVLRASGGGASVAWIDDLELRGALPVGGLDFVLPPAGTIEGRVLDAEGAPRTGAVVLASVTDFSRQRPTLSYAACEVDADGRYEIPGLPGGMLAVLLFSDGLRHQQGTPDMRMAALQAPGRATVDFVERRTVAQLRGRLLDGAGGALEGATLWLQQASGPERGSAFVSARTDADGRFGFEELTPGAHELYLGGLRPTEMSLVEGFEVAAGEVLEREFRLGDERVRGVLRAADGGAPVAGALVVLLAGPERRFVAKAMSEVDGTFALEHVRAGLYELIAAPVRGRLGSATVSGLAVAAGLGVEGLELALPRGGALEVRVLDGSGAPVGGARLALERDDGTPLYCDDEALSDGEGRWRHEALDLGGWRVRASRAGFRPAQARFELSAEAPAEVTLTLER